MLEKNQIFFDCLHLLTLHEPGNELYVIPEVQIPGGHVDFFLVSVKNSIVVDFIGIELQTLDTTGTVWPARQATLRELGILSPSEDYVIKKSYGMNWKMTAKTILVQMHHKSETFENVNKHIVLIVQNQLLDYMKREFSFQEMRPALLGDPVHIHSYGLNIKDSQLQLQLSTRISTNSEGIAKSLGLKSEAHVELEKIIKILQVKIKDEYRLSFFTNEGN